MINWQIRKEQIKNLKFNEKNPRKFTSKGLDDLKNSILKFSDANIITINADNTVLGGHARLTVMKQMGIMEVDVKYPDRLLTEKECDEILIRLNADIAGEWDIDKLKSDFDVDELESWGLSIDIDDIVEEQDDLYTRKITSPVYEITTEKPKIDELYSSEKYKKLIEEIELANIGIEDKNFLKKAATRHLVFNYKNIAEYYAHSSKEVQELMEKSALVIIDYNKAIEYGYVKLNQDILNLRLEDEQE